MAIPNQQTINIGLPDESAGSDSLYTAFNKINTNFNTLFGNSSPYNTFASGPGISVNANSTLGTVTVTNTGVTNIIAGTNITVSNSNGNVTISSNGGGNGGGGTVTSVGLVPVANSRITVTNSPVVASGNISIDLANTGVTSGSYVNPNLTIDSYGRILTASNGAAAGTVTSVGVIPGAGIQVSGSPITSNGNITITNTGVTRINAGTGITVSNSNGNVTISSPVTGGTVTSIDLTSSTLVVTGSPIVTSGTITVDLPTTITLSGNINGGNLNTTGDVAATGNIVGGYLVSAGNLGVIGTANILTDANVGGNVDVGGNINLATGDIIYTPRYGAFYSNADQTNPIANTAMAMTFNNTSYANGVSIVSSSQVTLAKAGIYNIQFSAQVLHSGGGKAPIDIWLNKNGSPVAETNTSLTLSSGDAYVAAWNFVESFTAGQYFEIMWCSTDTSVSLNASGANTSPTRPAVPSVILTVVPVGA